MVSAPKLAPDSQLVPPAAPMLKVVEAGATVPGPTRSVARRRLRLLLAVLHGVAGVAALVSGAMLIAQPGGESIGLTTAQLHGFADFFIPGILLGVLGVAQLGVAAWVTRPGASPLSASHWAGAFLVLFAAAQSALVVPLLGVAAFMALAGLVIYSVANELHRDEPHTPWLP